MKYSFFILLFLLTFTVQAQKRSRTGNPFMDKKKRPSELQRQQDAALVAKGNKAYEAQLDKVEKKLYNRRSKTRGGIGKTPKKKKRGRERI